MKSLQMQLMNMKELPEPEKKAVLKGNDVELKNVRFSYNGMADQEVFEAAKAVQCEEFIKKLPKGYDTVLGGI